MKKFNSGFTLLELMIIVAIIAILVTIGALNYNSSLRKSAEALTKGNMGAIRSAISIYYGENEAVYPTDDLTSISSDPRYFLIFPITRILPFHQDSALVTTELAVTETGGWSYNNIDGDLAFGQVHVGCLHQDSRSQMWSSY